MKQEYDFTGFPKEGFRDNMIKYWMENESIDTQQAIKYYCGDLFDKLCMVCDGTRLLKFKYEIDNKEECFEIEDNNFVIPVSIIEIYGSN